MNFGTISLILTAIQTLGTLALVLKLSFYAGKIVQQTNDNTERLGKIERRCYSESPDCVQRMDRLEGWAK